MEYYDQEIRRRGDQSPYDLALMYRELGLPRP